MLAALLVPVMVLTGTTQANAAGSGLGLAHNAWIVSDLAAEAYRAQGASSTAPTAAETRALTSGATTAGTTAKGFLSRAPKGGVLGLVLNGVGMLGATAYFWPGGDDAPEVPEIAGDQWQSSDGAHFKGIITSVERNGTSRGRQNWLINYSLANAPTFNSGFYTNQRELRGVHSYNISTGTPGGYITRSESNGWGEASLSVIADQPTTYALYYMTNDAPDTAQQVSAGTFTVSGVGQSAPDPSVEPISPAATPRYYETTITCTSQGGGTQEIVSRSPSFMFDPAQPAELPDAPTADCPAGTWLSGGTRTLGTDGTTTKVPIETYEAPPWVRQQTESYPQCAPVGPEVCVLRHLRVLPDGSTRECASTRPSPDHPCVDWYNDPNRTDNYRCTFGGDPVTLKACTPFRDSYRVDTDVRVQPMPPRDKPKTPTDVMAPPDPTRPDTNNPQRPPTDPDGDTDPNSRSCYGDAISLNPVDWVLVPVKCALLWAFVPRAGFFADAFARLSDSFNDSFLGKWVEAMRGLAPSGGDISGCAGPTFDISFRDFNKSVRPFNACSGAGEVAASIIKPLLTAGLIIFGCIACVRGVGTGFGWNVSIGRGGEVS